VPRGDRENDRVGEWLSDSIDSAQPRKLPIMLRALPLEPLQLQGEPIPLPFELGIAHRSAPTTGPARLAPLASPDGQSTRR